MQCNGTENIIVNGKLVVKDCDNTNTVKYKDNVNNRGFCIDNDNHMQEVIKIRKIMDKNYISKQKLIIGLNKQIRTCLCDELKEAGKLTAYYKIIEFIENDEFDDDNKN